MRNLSQKSGMKKVESRLIGEVFWRWTYRILFFQLENVQILLRRRQCVGWGQVRNSRANIQACRLECIESRPEGKQAPAFQPSAERCPQLDTLGPTVGPQNLEGALTPLLLSLALMERVNVTQFALGYQLLQGV